MTDDTKLTTLGTTYKDAVRRWQSFHGYTMPASFTTPMDEVMAALQNVVMFDISDMLYTVVSGENVLEFAHRLQVRKFNDTHDPKRTPYGRSKYTFFLDDGYVKEDGMMGFYDGKLVITTNVCLREEMLATYGRIADEVGGVEIADCTDTISAISVQGRNLEEVLPELFDIRLDRFAFTETTIRGLKTHALTGNVHGVSTTVFDKPLVFKLSYGVNGIEIVVDKEDGPQLWNHLEGLGITPAAQIARDWLRIIKGYPLNGNDFGRDERKTPHELGYGHLVENTDCIGYKEPKEERERYKRVSFVVDGGIGPLPRKGHTLFDERGNEIGHVTSGGLAPLPAHAHSQITKKRVGIGYVKKGYNAQGDSLYVDIRGKKHKAEIQNPPLIKDKDLKRLEI